MRNGKRIRKQIADLSEAEKESLLVCIADQLWPNGTLDHEWDADTTSAIARDFHDHGIVTDLRDAKRARSTKSR
jgi:hypothetical protein